MEILYETVGKWKENSICLIHNEEVWLIDPGDEFEKLDNSFKRHSADFKGIINTHGHFDHIGAVVSFKEKYKIPFYIHSKDKQLVRQGNLYKKLAGSAILLQTPSVDEFLDDKKQIPIGDNLINIHHTPGHTFGSVCFEIDKSLISGDLLFKDVIGRVDLPGGNIEMLKSSIHFVIDKFEGYTIYPGHGEPFILNAAVIDNLNNYL